MFMKEYLTSSPEATAKIAQQLASVLKGGEVLALSGNLGAGKTVFVKALAQALGVKENITSPTFVLMKVYDLPAGKIKKLVHLDCYRLEGREDLIDIGLGDYLASPEIVIVIEWADKVLNLPASTINIKIDYGQDNQRRIVID
jgi:tRNA threonylcarbamoyladenosine biosynthesis protein TsaE